MNIQNFSPQNGIGRIDLSTIGRDFAFTPVTLPGRPPVTSPVNRVVTPPTFQAVQLSDNAANPSSRSPVQNLQLFGGDRKRAVETLIASGAKAENPKTNLFQDIGRKLFGGTKTSSKPISATQNIHSAVKVKNFKFKELRLTTQGTNGAGQRTLRHVDFLPKTPTGADAQVRDAGTVIAKGSVTRMFEQEITNPSGGRPGKVVNNYFDPKTGQQFLKTTETAPSLETTKMGTVVSRESRATDRQIEVMNGEGQVTRRYVFDYGSKSVRLQNLDADGGVASTYNLSKKTNFNNLVDQLSKNSPSSRATLALGMSPVLGGGGRRFEGARLVHH
jgi:hypothetical protein